VEDRLIRNLTLLLHLALSDFQVQSHPLVPIPLPLHRCVSFALWR